MSSCEEFTGLKRQVCEGQIRLPGGGVRILGENERARFLASFRGEPIPERDPAERSVVTPPVPERIQQPRLQDVIGVGDELHELLASIGITESSGCGCKAKANEMNLNGVAWCERHHSDLVTWMVKGSEQRLRENKSKLLWLPESTRTAGERIVASKMLDEAVKRTRRKLATMVSIQPIAVGVTTAPRGGTNLLPRCVASILASGFDDVTVFAEPDSDVTGIDCPVITRPERFGAWRNWMQTLEDLLRHDADLILIAQDDTVFAKGVRDFCCVGWPDYGCAAIQLCCSSYYSRLPRGVSLMPGTGMVGAWATLMHRFYAEQILQYGRQHGWRGHHSRTEKNPLLKKAIDDYIGFAAEKLGYKCRIVRPSIVLHDADISTLGHGNSKGRKNNRATIDWIGTDAVALDCVPISKGVVTFQTSR